MSSSGLYLTSYDEVFQFPVNPEKLEIGNSASNSSMNVYGVGEATIIQDTKASVINFSSFFPKTTLVDVIITIFQSRLML